MRHKVKENVYPWIYFTRNIGPRRLIFPRTNLWLTLPHVSFKLTDII